MGYPNKGVVKSLSKVFERIGRLKQKYPSVHSWHEITVSDDGNGMATGISYRLKTGEYDDNLSGVYFRRTSLQELNEQTFRAIYNKTDQASKAHLNLVIRAYWLVSTIRYQLKQKYPSGHVRLL